MAAQARHWFGVRGRVRRDRLVYAEEYPTLFEAIAREKAIKKWRREWKVALIEQGNPEWVDLFERING